MILFNILLSKIINKLPADKTKDDEAEGKKWLYFAKLDGENEIYQVKSIHIKRSRNMTT